MLVLSLYLHHDTIAVYLYQRKLRIASNAFQRRFITFLMERPLHIKIERVTTVANDLDLHEVTGYVTYMHGNWWWVAYVLETDSENIEAKVTLLHPYGPNRSFKHPSQPDILTVLLTDVLTFIEPRTTTGSVYSITQRRVKLPQIY